MVDKDKIFFCLVHWSGRHDRCMIPLEKRNYPILEMKFTRHFQDEMAARYENALHLLDSGGWIQNIVEHPNTKDSIDTGIRERNIFGSTNNTFDLFRMGSIFHSTIKLMSVWFNQDVFFPLFFVHRKHTSYASAYISKLVMRIRDTRQKPGYSDLVRQILVCSSLPESGIIITIV